MAQALVPGGGSVDDRTYDARAEDLASSITKAGLVVGVGPNVVVVDEGMGKSATSITMTDDVYAFVFGQKGLMGGVGLQGNKITALAK